MYRLVIKNIQNIESAEIFIDGISVIIGVIERARITFLTILYSIVVSKVKKVKIENILVKELQSYILKNGEKSGEIKLYKDEKLIYELCIIAESDSIKFDERKNNLAECEYSEIIYLDINDIYDLEGIWEYILNSRKIKDSMKDLILKIKESENIKRKNRLELIETLITDLDRKEKALVLIEEPMLGLHLKKVKELVKILKKSKNVDIVFTTENSLLINYLISEDKIFLAEEKMGGINIKLNTNNEEILRSYIEPFTELRRLKFKNILE